MSVLPANDAKRRLIAIIKAPGTALTLERHGKDKYGRSLGRPYANDAPIADAMIKAGQARPYGGGKREPWQSCEVGQFPLRQLPSSGASCRA